MNFTVLKKGNQFRVFDCNTDDDLFYAFFCKGGRFFLSGDAYAGAIIPMQVIMPTLLFYWSDKHNGNTNVKCHLEKKK